MKAWHFFGDELRDGAPVPANGVKLEHKGPLVLCASGLHFSLEPWDALQYAPGDNLAYVEVADDSIMGHDKGVSPYRIILQRQNVRELLYDFACAEAWAVVKDKNPPAIVKQYLTSKGKERDAARYAAWDAARYAAQGAARYAAWDAAQGAARDAARYAAQGAARYAARYAAQGAARDAARQRQCKTFNRMVYDAFGIGY